MAAITDLGPAAKPTLQPVMANVLEKPPIVIVRARTSSPNDATLVNSAPG
jgi:hypothetical protein